MPDGPHKTPQLVQGIHPCCPGRAKAMCTVKPVRAKVVCLQYGFSCLLTPTVPCGLLSQDVLADLCLM